MRTVEFTHNKTAIIVDADNIKAVIAPRPQDVPSGLSRDEYWKARAQNHAHRQTRLQFKVSSVQHYQNVDQSYEAVKEMLGPGTEAEFIPAPPSI